MGDRRYRFKKDGAAAEYVARQYSGTLGKIAAHLFMTRKRLATPKAVGAA
ncbi:SRSO17 transposase [Arthrobacter pascens]|nr:hypothetical protein [Arthrobacter pascens]MDQ0678028.1 SRSO17 transposase [Arthrobacter pascens]